jgi:hypothetical protein
LKYLKYTIACYCLVFAAQFAAADQPADEVARFVRAEMVEHEGQWQGFETQISRYVDDRLAVVVLTNLDDAKPEQIADGVAQIYLAQKRRDNP